MRSSTVVVALAAASAVAPSLALPVSTPYARRAPSAQSADRFSVQLGTTGNNLSNLVHQLLGRQVVDETQALNLGKIANFAGIGSTIIGAITSIFHGNSDEQQQQRREFFELLARQEIDETQALNLGKIADIAGIGSSIIGAITSIFHGNSDEQQQQRRELFGLLARQNIEETQALNLGKFADIASIGSSVIGAITSLFHGNSNDQQQQRRELLELLARHLTENEARSLQLTEPIVPTSGGFHFGLNNLD